MRSILWSIVFFIMIQSTASAQVVEQSEFYSKENLFGINISTNGGLLGGLMFKFLRIKNTKVYNTYTLDFAYIKHPKESRVSNDPNSNVSFIPEKLNYFFSSRFQYGRDFIFFEKAPEEGVQISGVLSGGPSFGLLKPYYVLYSESNTSIVESIPYAEALKRKNFSKSKIFGIGGFAEGFGDSKIILGINLKAALSFKFSTFGGVSGFEAGFNLEAFAKKLEIMNYADKHQILTSAFVTVFFGNRKS